MKRGDLVQVSFKDHCFESGGVSDLLSCEVVGFIVRINLDSIVVAPWMITGDLDDANNDTYTILLHKGMRIKRLR